MSFLSQKYRITHPLDAEQGSHIDEMFEDLYRQIGVSALGNGILGVTSGGTGTGTAFTAGSVVFAGPLGVYAQDNTNFFWDDTNNRLIMSKLVGGTAAGATLSLQTTTGTATTTINGASVKILSGVNGATEIGRFYAESANDYAILAIGTTNGASIGSGGNKVRIFNSTGGRSGGLEVGTTDTTSGTDCGYFEFGTLGCPAAEKRAGAIHGTLEASAAATVTGSLRFFTTNAGTISEWLRITPTGLLAIGGGATSSFPALKRNSAELQARLADDSDFATLSVNNLGVGRSPTTTEFGAGGGAGGSRVLDLFTTGGVSVVSLHAGNTSFEGNIATDGAGLYYDSVGHATATNNKHHFRTSNTNSNYGSIDRLVINSDGTLDVKNTISNYNGFILVGDGIPYEAATIDTTGLTANVGATSLFSVPAASSGLYRVNAYVSLTTAASVSSTLPNVQVVYTDKDSNTAVTLDVTPIIGAAGLGETAALNNNTVGDVVSGTVPIYVKASTTIQYQTVNYASNAAGMTYALHIRLERL